ncbi:MAG: hypothetical protein HY517_00315 [Candidatus Aenigmarchaeota archaeon]|nr:hypothetical protein [Candidatus Aenigmarchaeota archaeon]
MNIIYAIILALAVLISGCISAANPFYSCERVQDQAARQECYGGIAVEQKNPALCKNLGEDVKDYCYYGSAWGAGDSLACGQIYNSTFRNVCIWNIALKERNISVCGELENKTLSENCIALAAKSPAECETIENSHYREICQNQTSGP